MSEGKIIRHGDYVVGVDPASPDGDEEIAVIMKDRGDTVEVWYRGDAQSAIDRLIADGALSIPKGVTMPTPDNEWLTTQDAADRLGVSLVYVQKLIKADKLPAEKFGARAYRLRATDVDALRRERDAALTGKEDGRRRVGIGQGAPGMPRGRRKKADER